MFNILNAAILLLSFNFQAILSKKCQEERELFFSFSSVKIEMVNCYELSVISSFVKKLPKFLQSCLWSYDLSKMDPFDENDKRIIITGVLNHGGDRPMRWLSKNYSADDLKEVISQPSRGMWLKDALNYWTKILNVKLKDWVYKLAILDIDPYSGQAELFYKHVLKGSK